MAASARSLEKVSGEDGLLPGERGFVRLGHFGGGPLAAVTGTASPVPHIVRNGRVRAEGLRHGSLGEARLSDALMAGGAAVCHVHPWQPYLIDAWTVIGKKFFRVRPALCILHKPALIVLPLRTKVLHRRNRQSQYANNC